MPQVIIVILFQRIAELKTENIKLKLRIYQLEKDSQGGKWEQIDECLATFTPLLECSKRILTCGQNRPVQTHLKNFKDLLELMSTTLINRPMLQGKGKVAASDAGDCNDSHLAPQGELKSVKPEVPGETQKSSWRSPVLQKRNTGPLNASTPSPLLGVSGSPESVGLQGLEDDIKELALQLEAKLVLSSPVLEEREEENRTLCSAASPAAPEAGVRELAVRTEDKPRQRCSLTDRAGASSTSTSALKGSGRATRNCGWEVKDLTARLKLTSVSAGFTIILDAGLSPSTKQQAETKAAMTSALHAPTEGIPARAREVSSLLSPCGGRAPELEDKPGGQGRTSLPRKDVETERSSSSSPALRGSGRATQTSAWDVKDLKVNFYLPSLCSSFTIDLGAAPSTMDGLKAARF
ncbi:uncharacterized protein LOC124467489 [Hypomesus transpacificus]|uniref:uncharacterized protein LOC124467489 n=1 Tax=Hypomesus transpacificus TaxID=137520 RepID=UPI001F085622|nr:uncharacterized protein LOC124467489 [Hypomesus transpacificus]